MKQWEMNDWLMINSIIYKLYATQDDNQMRTDFLEQLHMLIEFDSAEFFLVDEEQKFSSPALYHCSISKTDQYIQKGYLKNIMISSNSVVLRESDIISNEMNRSSEYYRKVYIPNNWRYALFMIISYNCKLQGIVILYRKNRSKDFLYDDVFILNMLKEHLSLRLLRQSSGLNFDNKLTVKEASEKYELTKREETILELLAKGIENEHICEKLIISKNTLRTHMMNIYRKLSVNSRLQLMNEIAG